MRKSYLEQSEEPQRTSVKIIGIILGVMVTLLIAYCFIHCPQYMMVESRMTRSENKETIKIIAQTIIHFRETGNI